MEEKPVKSEMKGKVRAEDPEKRSSLVRENRERQRGPIFSGLCYTYRRDIRKRAKLKERWFTGS